MATLAEVQATPTAAAIFSRAGALLASAGGYRDTLQKTLAACLPSLGDFGFFDARDETGVVRLADAHDDGRIAGILRGTQWVRQARDDINVCALSSGLAALHEDIDEAWYRRIAQDDAHLELLRTLAFRSMITVPMRCRGELIGALTLFMGASGRRHTLDHLSVAASLASLCAPAIANAALLERGSRVEAALQEAKRAGARMAAIVESCDDAIISTTLDGRIVSWNPGAARLYGYEAREIVGQPVARIIPEELQPQEAQLLERVRRGEHIQHYETVRVDRSGRRFPVSLTVSPVRDAAGAIVGTSKIARDISERRRADEELRSLRDQLAEELQAMRRLQLISSRLINRHDRLEDLLLEILDAALRITSAERGVIQLYDEATGELRFAARRGFTADFAAQFARVGGDERLPSARALRERRRIVVEDVADDPDVDPRRVPVFLEAGVRSLQSTPLISRHGRLVGMFTTHSTVRGRPSERELRMLDLLSRAAADLIDRAQVEAELTEADRRKDEFLAILAHELRNPLAPIRYAVSVARQPGSSEEQRRSAEIVIERQVRHMGRLLDDLLDVSRIARGMVELQRETVEVAGAIATAMEAARPLVAAKRHELVVDVPEQPLWVDADPVRLTQVLTNLITNAAKYTDPGGRIRVTARVEAATLELSVSDTGIGISEQLRPRLFTLFAQADSALRRSQGGLGIGLALVKAFVELHGGAIEVRSEPGRGSEFVVRLPGASGPPQEVEPDAHKAVAEGRHGVRVLVADDNEDACETCAMLLQLWGHQPARAADGTAALQRIEELRPQVALLDIGMPGMNGYEVAERVRAAPWGADIVLVAVTGWGQQEARNRSAESGFDAHLTKPVEAAALERLLRAVQRGELTPAARQVTSR